LAPTCMRTARRDLGDKRVYISLDAIRVTVNVRREIAVRASRYAKGNVKINTGGHRISQKEKVRCKRFLTFHVSLLALFRVGFQLA
jgi:hypothetical protein